MYRKKGIKVPGYDMTVNEYSKIISYFDEVRFCGNVSDPVFNPNFIEFLKMNYENNISTKVHTAATGKSLDWYKKAFKANPKAMWIFGLDGLPEDSPIYRKNQDGKALFQIMKTCRKMGLDTVWIHIIFRYNENTIDQCKAIAKENDIFFYEVKSDRFDGPEDPLRPLKKENYQ